MRKESVNTFNEGLNYDLNPITTPNNVLTDNVNGTFITFNGDELALQNDAGNTKIGVGIQNEDGTFDTYVQLSDGFYPLGVKEYGGVLYIISRKIGPLGDGTDDLIEFGSYPSPDVIDYNDGLTGTDLSLTNSNLEEEKYIIFDNKEFNPGLKLELINDIDSTGKEYVSHYVGETWTRKTYKVGLYQKYQNSSIDVTKKYSLTGIDGYWFLQGNILFNNYLNKGTLYTKIELEPIDYFTLVSSSIGYSGTDGLLNLTIKSKSTCSFKIFSIEVIVEVDGMTIPDPFPLGETGLGWNNESENQDDFVITIPDLLDYISSENIKFTIIPMIVCVNNPSDYDFANILNAESIVEDYIADLKLIVEQIIPNIYDTFILNPQDLLYEKAVPALNVEYGNIIVNPVAKYGYVELLNLEGDYIDEEGTVQLTNYGVEFNGYTGSGLTNSLGTYSIDEDNKTVVSGGALISQDIEDRINELSLVEIQEQPQYLLTLNFSQPVSRFFVGFIANKLPDYYLTAYHSPKYDWITSITNPQTGNFGYFGTSTYKQYDGASWQNISTPLYYSEAKYRLPEGEIYKLNLHIPINSDNTPYSLTEDVVWNVAVLPQYLLTDASYYYEQNITIGIFEKITIDTKLINIKYQDCEENQLIEEIPCTVTCSNYFSLENTVILEGRILNYPSESIYTIEVKYLLQTTPDPDIYSDWLPLTNTITYVDSQDLNNTDIRNIGDMSINVAANIGANLAELSKTYINISDSADYLIHTSTGIILEKSFNAPSE